MLSSGTKNNSLIDFIDIFRLRLKENHYEIP